MVRLADEFNSPFIFQYLRSDLGQKKLLRKAIGSAQQVINLIDLRTVEIHFPSLPEQQKIAAFLGAVDEKLAQLQKKKALLEDYKKGCMQKLFSRELRFKDDDGNYFPEWDEKRLGDLAARVRKKNNQIEVTDVLTNSAVNGIVHQSDYFDHDVANADNLDRYTIAEVGDFVYNPRISVTAPVGPIKRNDLCRGVMSPLYDVFRFDDQDTEFWKHYYASAAWHRYMKQVANYGARHDRMAISRDDFDNMPMPYPVKDERKKIANFLSALDTKIQLVTAEIEQAQTFKKGLLQQMFE